jgi:AcrR family transcriptional regulator
MREEDRDMSERRAVKAKELREAARELIAAGGPSLLTLRGVARAVGLSPAAIYRYYPGLDSLVDAVRADLCAELKLFVESARDSATEDDPVARISRISLAFRSWALERRAEFTLLFGPQPACQMDSVGARKRDPSYQLGILFFDEFAEIWLRRQTRSPVKALPWVSFDRYLDRRLIERYPGLPTWFIFASLMAWTKLCGLILMEASGQLAWVVADGRSLFEIELADLARRLTVEGGEPFYTGIPEAGRCA